MKKKLIRLTESDLHRIIKESVQRILAESETTDSDMYWSDSDVVNINTHDATYYPEAEEIEFDVNDANNGIPFVIEPVLNMNFEDWTPEMIDDIEWGVDYYASPEAKKKYAAYQDAIDNLMKTNRKHYIERLRDEFKTP